MSIHKPFDPDRPLFSSRCSCGLHASESEHHAAQLLKLMLRKIVLTSLKLA